MAQLCTLLSLLPAHSAAQGMQSVQMWYTVCPNQPYLDSNITTEESCFSGAGQSGALALVLWMQRDLLQPCASDLELYALLVLQTACRGHAAQLHLHPHTRAATTRPHQAPALQSAR